MEACEEVAGGLFVTCGDGPEVFDGIEEALDEIAFGVECEVAVALGLAIGFWRDDRFDGAHFKAFDEAVGVISLVGDHGPGFNLSRQRLGLCDVMGLAAREADRQRISQCIDDGMDLRRKPAARPAYGLVRAPFLRAPGLC